MNVQAMAGMAPAFNLRWDSSRASYFVDKPNIGDTAVYTAEQVAALQQQLAAAREALQAAEADAARYRWARAALAGAFGPMTKEERLEFLAQIAREMAKAEARRQPHPQQKLDV